MANIRLLYICNKITSTFPLLWLISLATLKIRESLEYHGNLLYHYPRENYPHHWKLTAAILFFAFLGSVIYLISCILLLVHKKKLPLITLILFITSILIIIFIAADTNRLDWYVGMD